MRKNMDYEEESLLIEYVWRHGAHLMTELERKGVKTVHANEKAEHSSPDISGVILEKWGSKDNPEVCNALSAGIKKFKQAVRRRVISDNPEFVQRCPECKKIIRTPQAQQCRWCGSSWHMS